MLEVILLRVMLERLLEETKVFSVTTEFYDYQVEIGWDITMRCNYSCSYCESYNNNQPTYFKDIKIYEKALNYLKNYLDNKKACVSILGGEPLLYKDWDKLINLIHDLDFVPKVFTNLSISKKALERKIKTLTPKNFIDVSCHLQFAKTEDLIDKINLISASGHLKGVSVLADTRYWDQVIDLYEKLKHIENVYVSVIKDESPSQINIASNIINYSKEQMDFINNSESEYKPYFKTTVNNKFELFSINDFYKNNITNFKGMLCEIGQLNLNIKPNGDVYPSACLLNYPKAVIGNIYKEDLLKPTKPIECPFNFCGCGPDMRIKKYTKNL